MKKSKIPILVSGIKIIINKKLGMLQYVKTWKKSIFKFHFSVKLYTKYINKVMIQNCLLHKDLQVWIATFLHKMYIFLFNFKKYYWKSKI